MINQIKGILFPFKWKRVIFVDGSKFLNFERDGIYTINKTKYNVTKVGNILRLRRVTLLNFHQEPTLSFVIPTENSQELIITFQTSTSCKIFSLFWYFFITIFVLFVLFFGEFVFVLIGVFLIVYGCCLFNFTNYILTTIIMSDLKTLCK